MYLHRTLSSCKAREAKLSRRESPEQQLQQQIEVWQALLSHWYD
ncbi:MAG TPA: hypothetical protein V6D14_28055 [Coleofasciculaceae cyanobacterium]